MGENISHSLNLLELRVKLPHLQKFVIIELQSINEGMIWRVKYKKRESVQFSSKLSYESPRHPTGWKLSQEEA